MEGALIHDVQARFVAVEEAELGSGRELAERGGHAGDLTFLGAIFHAAFEEAVFDGPGAAQSPIGGGHFLDHAEFDIVRPWRSAFREERALPSGVLGPRERAPLALAARIRFSEVISSQSQDNSRNRTSHSSYPWFHGVSPIYLV